jgi:hypothetical protein
MLANERLRELALHRFYDVRYFLSVQMCSKYRFLQTKNDSNKEEKEYRY